MTAPVERRPSTTVTECDVCGDDGVPVEPIPATPDLFACHDCMDAPDDPERFTL